MTMYSLLYLFVKVEPAKYVNTKIGFKLTVQEDGLRGLARGWAPTFVGYSLQGMCKFGFYEVFKILYWNALGEASPHIQQHTLWTALNVGVHFLVNASGSLGEWELTIFSGGSVCAGECILVADLAVLGGICQC